MTAIVGTLRSAVGVSTSSGPPMRDDYTPPPAEIDVVELTESEYRNLEPKVHNTFYIIVE